MRGRLQKAFDHVLAKLGERMDPATIIAELVGQHSASFRHTGQSYSLRVAGINATCSWSKDVGLLKAWRTNAALKLLEPEEGFGRE